MQLGGICSGVPTDMEIAEMASLNEGRRTPLVLSPGVVKKLARLSQTTEGVDEQMSQNHLSTSDIAIYRANASRSMEIGRHLLICKECRAKLPVATPHDFLNCVLEDSLQVESQRPRSAFAVPRFSTFPIARASAFAGLIFVLIIGLYLVAGDRLAPSETTVARGGHSDVGMNVDSVPPLGTETLPSPVDHPPAPEDPDRRSGPVNTKKNEKSGQGRTQKALSPAPTVRNVETRGNENPCSNRTTVNLESVSDGKEVVLKWNAVRGAASYEIYIADLDENLIDHFESKSQTSYRSSVVLEPAKTYRWKLVITLTNGNRIVGPPQGLKKPGTSTTDPIRSEAIEKQRTSFEMRCVGTR